jgi:hypothetical protein
VFKKTNEMNTASVGWTIVPNDFVSESRSIDGVKVSRLFFKVKSIIFDEHQIEIFVLYLKISFYGKNSTVNNGQLKYGIEVSTKAINYLKNIYFNDNRRIGEQIFIQ